MTSFVKSALVPYDARYTTLRRKIPMINQEATIET